MNLRATVAMLGLAATGCVHQVQSARVTAPTKPQTVWERQVNNARDAGDGDYQLRALRERVAAEPDNIAIRVELANLYRQKGYPDIAVELCRLTAGRFPESGEAQLALVRALHDLHRSVEAAAGLNQFLNSHPQTSPEYYSWLGILRDEIGQSTEGEQAHRKAVELKPTDDSLHNNLGYNLLMQGKAAEAATEFQAALKLNPGSQIARNNLGMALARQDASREAVASWQAGSDPATAHNNLAAVLIEKGNYAEARKELNVALGYNRSLPAALRNLELVQLLDGSSGPVTLSPVEATRWDRFLVSVKRLFVGPLDEPRKDPARTASAPATGEQR